MLDSSRERWRRWSCQSQQLILLSQNGWYLVIANYQGYFLLFEGMLDSVINARDKYLAPDGISNYLC